MCSCRLRNDTFTNDGIDVRVQGIGITPVRLHFALALGMHLVTARLEPVALARQLDQCGRGLAHLNAIGSTIGFHASSSVDSLGGRTIKAIVSKLQPWNESSSVYAYVHHQKAGTGPFLRAIRLRWSVQS
jgi:hypothetical protein